MVRGKKYRWTLPFDSRVDSLYESISSFKVIIIDDKDTIWFQGTYSVLVCGLNGLRWNWSVTASPPLTITSNLSRHITQWVYFWLLISIDFTHHPPVLVNVNPNLESRSTETRMPIMPNPCGDKTWPRTTDTRLEKKKFSY